ncbi:MAG: endonuclease [Marinilabiliaceae bacterium]|nr:endonuclease [Marinilabiliaceae bacterium]
MRKPLSHLLLILLLVSFFSCNKEEQLVEQEVTSGVNLCLDLKSATTSLLKDHLLDVNNDQGEVVQSFIDLDNLPSTIDLKSGTYEIAVRYTGALSPQFNYPIYGGKQSVTVTKDQTTDLSLEVTQANFGIAVAYADDFKSSFSNYSVAISSPDGDLSYPDSETRFGYFFKGPITITLTYTDAQNAVQQQVKTLAADNPSINAGTALTVKYQIGNGGDVYEGYYESASNKTGLELKSTLGDIISANYRSRSYGDLWNIYKLSDIRADGTIWDMYSDNPNGANPYDFMPGSNQCGGSGFSGEGDCYNREHSVPKSWFDDASPMYTDMVHLVPTDGKVNNMRSNFPFGEVGTASNTSENGCKVGSARSGLGYSGTVFEPIDAYKGDFARIYFYFVTRYDDRIAGWNNAVFSTDEYGLDQWVINMMLEWHTNDPVSDKERNRNTYIQEFQSNRNPYVDHPEFVDMIWGAVESKQVLKNGVVCAGFELIYSVN